MHRSGVKGRLGFRKAASCVEQSGDHIYIEVVHGVVVHSPTHTWAPFGASQVDIVLGGIWVGWLRPGAAQDVPVVRHAGETGDVSKGV